MTTEAPAKPNLRRKYIRALIPAVAIVAIAAIVLTLLRSRVEDSEFHPGEVKIGAQMPEFTMLDLAGNEVSISDMTAKLLVVNFWATWCEPCKTEMPSLEQLRKGYFAKGVEVIGISVDENPTAVVPRMAEKLGISFPVFVDQEGSLSELFDVHAIPFTVILRRYDRQVLYIEAGERDWNAPEVRKKLDEWLAAS